MAPPRPKKRDKDGWPSVGDDFPSVDAFLAYCSAVAKRQGTSLVRNERTENGILHCQVVCAEYWERRKDGLHLIKAEFRCPLISQVFVGPNGKCYVEKARTMHNHAILNKDVDSMPKALKRYRPQPAPVDAKGKGKATTEPTRPSEHDELGSSPSNSRDQNDAEESEEGEIIEIDIKREGSEEVEVPVDREQAAREEAEWRKANQGFFGESRPPPTATSVNPQLTQSTSTQPAQQSFPSSTLTGCSIAPSSAEASSSRMPVRHRLPPSRPGENPLQPLTIPIWKENSRDATQEAAIRNHQRAASDGQKSTPILRARLRTPPPDPTAHSVDAETAPLSPRPRQPSPPRDDRAADPFLTSAVSYSPDLPPFPSTQDHSLGMSGGGGLLQARNGLDVLASAATNGRHSLGGSSSQPSPGLNLDVGTFGGGAMPTDLGMSSFMIPHAPTSTSFATAPPAFSALPPSSQPLASSQPWEQQPGWSGATVNGLNPSQQLPPASSSMLTQPFNGGQLMPPPRLPYATPSSTAQPSISSAGTAGSRIKRLPGQGRLSIASLVNTPSDQGPSPQNQGPSPLNNGPSPPEIPQYQSLTNPNVRPNFEHNLLHTTRPFQAAGVTTPMLPASGALTRGQQSASAVPTMANGPGSSAGSRVYSTSPPASSILARPVAVRPESYSGSMAKLSHPVQRVESMSGLSPQSANSFGVSSSTLGKRKFAETRTSQPPQSPRRAPLASPTRSVASVGAGAGMLGAAVVREAVNGGAAVTTSSPSQPADALEEMKRFCAGVHPQLEWFGTAFFELGCDSLDFLFASSRDLIESFFANDIPERYPEVKKKPFLLRKMKEAILLRIAQSDEVGSQS